MQGVRMVRVEEVRAETPKIKTITFRDDAPAMPGQFYMVWIPGVDEIPMSIALCNSPKGISVNRIGDATTRLHALKAGDLLGIRGPFGTSYVPKGRTLLVAGGCGAASVAAVADCRWPKSVKLEAVVAAKTASELLFVERLEKAGVKVHTATDDGSAGFKGFATDCVRKLLAGQKKGYDTVLSCGPEVMLRGLLDICREHGIRYQASLERHMKCGVGVCDACSISGLQVCRDGPVFDADVLAALPEFGRTKRDVCGRSVPL